MSSGRTGPDEETPTSSRYGLTQWAIWGLPPRLLSAVLTVEVTAVVLMAGFVVRDLPPSPTTLLVGGLIVLLGVLHTEIAQGVERVRRRLSGDLHVNMSSVWFFAAAVLLPLGSAALAALAVQLHLWVRSARHRLPLYKHVFNTATTMLSVIAAHGAMAALSEGGTAGLGQRWDVPVLLLGVLVYLTVNTALVAGAIAVHSPQSNVAAIVGEWDENLLEVATLCLGAIAAAAIAINPWLVAFVFPPLLVLHRAVLVRHLEVAASTDGKTGLLNAAAWHTQAERELRRAERRAGPRAVLVIDLDHFKAVNDTHGHLAGDRVLAAVADALRAEVRDRDLVGRFGGEEFVVLLGGLAPGGVGEPGSGGGELRAVAERIRERIAALRVEMPTADGPLTVAGLSASVGCARYPDDGRDLRDLLQVADTALYAAKRAGRNVVRMGVQPLSPDPVVAEQCNYGP